MEKIKTILLFILFSNSLNSFAQEFDVSQNYERKKAHYWRANWIAHPDASPYDYGVYHFRRSFQLDEVPENLDMYISADNRYKLYINGQYITIGPARGDLFHWRYETIDVSPYLKEGDNVIAALVYNMGEHTPVSWMSRQTAFICQIGEAEKSLIYTGDGNWKVTQNRAYQPIPWHWQVSGYYVAGPGDQVEATKYPWNWEKSGFDDSEWNSPVQIAHGKGRGSSGNSHYYLVPRSIPLLEQKTQRIPVIRNIEGQALNIGFHKSQSTEIPANSKVSVLFDNEVYTMGFPRLKISKGKNSKIKITYAETLLNPDKTKGNRDKVEGKKIYGIYDEYYPDGGIDRVYSPLWVKTFRYIQLDIETGDEPLIISDYYNVFTAYPFKENAVFDTEDEDLKNIWDMSWRTSRLCALETYMDCPYFEQLNYIGDTRVQAMISLFVSGDDRLMKDAIRLFDYSMVPEGITQGRYPSRVPVMIPTYSLFYISMLHDLYRYREEDTFIKEYLPSVRSILEYYEGYLDEKNMLNSLEWWQYVDAAYKGGVPPGTNDGNSTMVNLLYVYALQQAVDLFEHFGWHHEANKWKETEDKIKLAVKQHCYEPDKGLLAETPDKKDFAQHSNIFAILTNTVPENQHTEIMQKVINDESLLQTKLFFNFYFFRALKKSGLAHLYLDHLDVWHNMLDYGYTTCGEWGNLETDRSDCHAWSATPVFDYMNILLGIDASKPGFKEVEINPTFGKLNKLKGSFPHPKGDIKIDLTKKKNKVSGSIYLPQGLSGKLIIGNKQIDLNYDENRIKNVFLQETD